MDDSRQTAFVERLTRLDDDRLLSTLLQMAEAPDQYRAEAFAAVNNEVTRRGITSDRVSEAESRAQQDRRESLVSDAVKLALNGLSSTVIEGDLVVDGLDPTEAADIAERAGDLARERRKRTGYRNLMNGAGLCLVGCVLTWAIYDLAGSVLRVAGQPLAWGAVVAGVALCVRGVRQVVG
jgi:hypothetical protein